MMPPMIAGEREAGFLQAIRELALLLGYRFYHTHDSRRSDAGFVDLVMAKPGLLLCAELKVGHKRPTVSQWEWLTGLGSVPGVEAFLWYPRHWQALEARLKGGKGHNPCRTRHGALSRRAIPFSRRDPRLAWVCETCGFVCEWGRDARELHRIGEHTPQ